MITLDAWLLVAICIVALMLGGSITRVARRQRRQARQIQTDWQILASRAADLDAREHLLHKREDALARRMRSHDDKAARRIAGRR